MNASIRSSIWQPVCLLCSGLTLIVAATDWVGHLKLKMAWQASDRPMTFHWHVVIHPTLLVLSHSTLLSHYSTLTNNFAHKFRLCSRLSMAPKTSRYPPEIVAIANSITGMDLQFSQDSKTAIFLRTCRFSTISFLSAYLSYAHSELQRTPRYFKKSVHSLKDPLLHWGVFPRAGEARNRHNSSILPGVLGMLRVNLTFFKVKH